MPDLYFLIFGIVCSLAGAVLVMTKIAMFVRCRMKVDAEISSVKKKAGTLRGSTVYSYIPSFVYTAEGKSYKGTCPFSTYRKDKYKTGDSIRIYVNEKDPSQYRFRGRFGLLVLGIALLAAGLLFVVLYFI